MPVELASTVHTTLQSSTQSDNILNAQLNNIKIANNTDLSTSNSTASCAGGGSFLVYWTFTNGTFFVDPDDDSTRRVLGIHNSTGTAADIVIDLQNQTSTSGVHGGLSGEIIIFASNSTTGDTSGLPTFEDSGDLTITVVCRSGSTPATTPGTNDAG